MLELARQRGDGVINRSKTRDTPFITRAGDEALRSVLVVGATAVIQHVRRGGRGSPWIVDLLKRKPPKLAAVALANKMARIAWKLMVTGNSYAAKSAPTALMGAA